MANIQKNEDKHERFLRRQRLKGYSAALVFAGFAICNQLTLAEGFHGLPYWLGLTGGLALICYGLITYLPLRREEKKEIEAWKKEEQAELEAANAFLFGTDQNRK